MKAYAPQRMRDPGDPGGPLGTIAVVLFTIAMLSALLG